MEVFITRFSVCKIQLRRSGGVMTKGGYDLEFPCTQPAKFLVQKNSRQIRRVPGRSSGSLSNPAGPWQMQRIPGKSSGPERGIGGEMYFLYFPPCIPFLFQAIPVSVPIGMSKNINKYKTNLRMDRPVSRNAPTPKVNYFKRSRPSQLPYSEKSKNRIWLCFLYQSEGFGRTA